MRAKLVPELEVEELARSLAFYVDVLCFSVAWARPEEGFVFLDLNGASIMLESAGGPGRRFRTAPLEQPFGRGVNIQILVADVDELHERIVRAGYRPLLALEDRWYRAGEAWLGQRQFVVADPDGYLLRFASELAHGAVPDPDARG